MSIVQGLGEEDENTRFVRPFRKKINADADLVKHVVLSDKSSFSLSGKEKT